MTMPIPLLKSGATAAALSRAWVSLDRSQPGSVDLPPRLLLALPPTWNNRYQSLLYGDAGPRRYAVLGVADDTVLRHVSWPGQILLHAHWFASLFNTCRDEFDAAARLAYLQDNVHAFQERTGAALLWTAHNVLPHGNRFPETFLELRRWLFATFDAIHVMQEGHVPLLEEAYGARAQQYFVVPHMTYEGAQADCVSSSAAKVHYGINPEDFVFAYFGSIHPYKNLDSMLSAVDRVAESSTRGVTAIVGGVPSDAGTVQRLRQRWGLSPRVRLIMQTVPDHEIQYIHRAADAIVLPYSETLNSGAAFMAASFTRPIIMPTGSASSALDGLGTVSYDPSAARGLDDAMKAVMEGKRGNLLDEAKARSAPNAVSNAFFDELDALFDRRPAKPIFTSGQGVS